MIVEPSFFHHWKTKLLISILSDPASPLCVLKLWAHCQERKTARLRLSPEALAAVCEWQDDPIKLREALKTCGFLEESSEALVVHDWEKQNWYLVNAWKNGRKNRTRRYPVGIPPPNPRVTHPSNLISSNLSVQSTGTVPVPEQDWIKSLKASPAYNGIDVEREFHKMVEWCNVHKQRPTKQRLVNWLNRADTPLLPIKKPQKEPLW